MFFELAPGIRLRPYQTQTVQKLLANYFEEQHGGVVVVPCFGKTLITLCAAGVIGRPFVVLVPSTEIGVQWAWQLLSSFRVGKKLIQATDIGLIGQFLGRRATPVANARGNLAQPCGHGMAAPPTPPFCWSKAMELRRRLARARKRLALGKAVPSRKDAYSSRPPRKAERGSASDGWRQGGGRV